jgi:hypothetical protein
MELSPPENSFPVRRSSLRPPDDSAAADSQPGLDANASETTIDRDLLPFAEHLQNGSLKPLKTGHDCQEPSFGIQGGGEEDEELGILGPDPDVDAGAGADVVSNRPKVLDLEPPAVGMAKPFKQNVQVETDFEVDEAFAAPSTATPNGIPNGIAGVAMPSDFSMLPAGLPQHNEPLEPLPTAVPRPSTSSRMSRRDSDEAPEERKSLNRRLSASLRRRSWVPGSRSPSPRKPSTPRTSSRDRLPTHSESVSASTSRSATVPIVQPNGARNNHQRQPSFAVGLAQRLRKKPSVAGDQAEMATSAPREPLVAPAPAPASLKIPKSASADRLAIPPRVPKSKSGDRISSFSQPNMIGLALSSSMRAAKKRDELWTAFRDLQASCHK